MRYIIYSWKTIRCCIVTVIKISVTSVDMVVGCCVPYCKTRSNSGFHNFPANNEIRVLWLKAIKIFQFDEETKPNSFRKICKKHFLPTDYQTHANGIVRLKYGSVPSQHLPNPLWMEHSYVNRQRENVSPIWHKTHPNTSTSTIIANIFRIEKSLSPSKPRSRK